MSHIWKIKLFFWLKLYRQNQENSVWPYSEDRLDNEQHLSFLEINYREFDSGSINFGIIIQIPLFYILYQGFNLTGFLFSSPILASWTIDVWFSVKIFVFTNVTDGCWLFTTSLLINFPRPGKMVKMWHFLIFLELCCDQTVWFFQIFSTVLKRF